MKRIEVVEVCSWNNEIHLVIQEHKKIGPSRKREIVNFAEVKKIMKKEAAKPLFLQRT